jgi:hypothetical protein
MTMGSGRRANHQHHQVNPGPPPARPVPAAGADNGAATQIAAVPDGIEHLTPHRQRLVRHLAYQPATGDTAGTLEVTFRTGGTYRVSGIPTQTWHELQDAAERNRSVHYLWSTGVLAQPAAEIESGTSWYAELLRDGRPRTRCSRCGQFTGLAAHRCPVATMPERRHYFEHGMLYAPLLSLVREAVVLSDEPVLVDVHGQYRDPDTGVAGDLTGAVAVYDPASPDAGEHAADGLDCTCGRPRCAHRQLAAADVTGSISSPSRLATARRASTTVLSELGAEHAAAQAAQQRAQQTWPAPEVSYLDDVDAFQAAYQDTLRRIERGEDAVPLLYEDATGGLGARGHGRGFGVEIEFELGEEASYGARRNIAHDLADAGLAEDSTIWGYHEPRIGGYTDARDGWRLEEDSTVDGEIVSPILFDTPETWQDIEAVCAIVRAHGGIATVSTGGHVHVATGNFDHLAANHARLLRLVAAYQDTLFRLATNPERRTHRGTAWCTPNPTASAGFESVTQVRQRNSSHGVALNLSAVHGRPNDHAEFRMWDGSLDAAVIQTQVKLSLGLTEAALRTSGHAGDLQVDPLGGHHHAFGDRGGRLRGEDWRAATRSFRALVDTVFHRAVDKAQATSLFAITRWAQPATRSAR